MVLRDKEHVRWGWIWVPSSPLVGEDILIGLSVGALHLHMLGDTPPPPPKPAPTYTPGSLCLSRSREEMLHRNRGWTAWSAG